MAVNQIVVYKKQYVRLQGEPEEQTKIPASLGRARRRSGRELRETCAEPHWQARSDFLLDSRIHIGKPET